MEKRIKETPMKAKHPAHHKHVKRTALKKKTIKIGKATAKKKTIGMFPENDVKAKIHSKIKEIDKKLDEIKLMVNGYRKIKDLDWGHFGNLARILSTLNEIC